MWQGISEASAFSFDKDDRFYVKDSENTEFSSKEKLIRAVLQIWANQGHSAVSARALSRATELPTSSIYHHFGSMEQLFQSAQGYAHDAARIWCSRKLEEMNGWPKNGGVDSLARALAILIDDWTTECRDLAFAWSQCHLLAQRDETYVAAIDAWRDHWAAFWRELCGQAGLGRFAAMTSHIFEATAQFQLMRWHRTIDRAALDEFCMGWGRWLAGELAEEGPWRRHAREQALASAPEVAVQNGVAAAISSAAADIVEEGGVAALTHRAVAARAQVTLGVTSYNFRTSADLVRAAFNDIYQRLIQPLEKPVTPVDRDVPIVAWRDFGSQPRRLAAMEELMLAVAQDPDLRDFAPQLRYLRGRSSRTLLAGKLGGDAPISPLDAAIYSCLVSGQRRALIGRSEAEIHANLDEMDLLIAGLRAGL
jgi:AcrR family transcriptional regulator